MQYYEYPLKAAGERPWRSYLGGRELDRMHGKANPEDSFAPEEWILSTTRAVNVGRENIEEGICYLADVPERVSLKQLIEQHPVEMLGARHVAVFGADMGVLVKTIDSAVRLVIQVHPDRETALRLLGSRFGKTECWHILGLRDDGEEPSMYLGFREGVTEREWRDVFERQDVERMKEMLVRLTPKVGETFIVHGGVPHAIGPGCLLIEIQEPTDITVRLEKKLPYGVELAESSMHQGLGFERMFECFRYDGMSEAQVRKEWVLPPRAVAQSADGVVESLVDYDVTPCFRMERLTVTGTMAFARQEVFSGMYVVDGRGELVCGDRRFELAKNDQIFVPAACADFSVRNAGGDPLRMIRFNGPKV